MKGTGRKGPRKPGNTGAAGGIGRTAGGAGRAADRRTGADNRRPGTSRADKRKPNPAHADGRRTQRSRAESFSRTEPPRSGGNRRAAGSAGDLPGRGAAAAPYEPAARLKPGRIKGEWMEIRLPDGLAGAPLQAVLRHVPIPAKLLSKLMQSRGVLLQGATLRLHLFPRERIDFPADWMELNVLHEDEFTLVVGKPAGIEVHPSEQGQRRTLAHAVAAYYEMTGQDVRVRHIHRIDKDTTGPVLYAKNEFAHYQYDKDMREKRIERVYLALAEGEIAADRGTIEKPIGQDRHHSTRRRISETGDPAVTHFEVVERFGDHTLVRLRLETGRTHQIRVHLSAIGHPLAGDGMYGGSRKVMSRQALHGEKLIWRHPWTGEKQQVRAPLPDDFALALEALRGRG